MVAFQLSMFSSSREETVALEVAPGVVERIQVAGSDDPRVRAYREKNKDLFYWAKSGFHKSIRRADFPRARGFAGLLDRAKPGESRRYLRKILFEETRSLEVMDAYYRGATLMDLVRMACQSRKDWEIQNDRGIFSPDWFRVAAHYGWDAVENESSRWDDKKKPDIKYPYPDEAADVFRLIVKMCDESRWEDLYDAVACATMWTPNGDLAARSVRHALVTWCAEHRSPLARHLSPVSGHPEELTALWALASGEQTVEHTSELVHPADLRTEIEFPLLDVGILDCHTREGKARRRRFGDPVWGCPQPEQTDIRWSGAHAGTLWRHLAYSQYGTVDVPFESVVPSPDILRFFGKTRSPVI